VVQCRIFYTDTGRLIASRKSARNGTGVSHLQASVRALEEASDQLCDELIEATDAFWHKEKSGPKTYELVLSGIKYEESKKIREYLQRLPGTLSVVERELNATQAVYSVALINMSIDQLLEAILSEKCPVSGWVVRLKSGNNLNLARQY
jgi:hypothetical protein